MIILMDMVKAFDKTMCAFINKNKFSANMKKRKHLKMIKGILEKFIANILYNNKRYSALPKIRNKTRMTSAITAVIGVMEVLASIIRQGQAIKGLHIEKNNVVRLP